MLAARIQNVKTMAGALIPGHYRHKPTGFEVGSDQRRWQQCNPQPRQRRPAQCLSCVGIEPTGELHSMLGALRPDQSPARQSTGMTGTHTIMVDEILQPFWHAMCLNVTWAGNHALRTCRDQLTADVTRVQQWPAPERNVQTLGDQIGACIGKDEFQLHFRVSGKKIGNPLHRKKVEEISHRGNPHLAAGDFAA